MSSTQSSLEAQANERKARLAQLRNLKRKQQSAAEEDDVPSTASTTQDNPAKPVDAASRYLSGRNYDVVTRGPRLGFDQAPTEGEITVEDRAAAIEAETKQWRETEERADKPVDLFTLQPKKPNWDLKRDLDRKLEILNVRTDNAIAKLVRQRIQEQEKAKNAGKGAEAAGDGVGGDENVGIDGTSLLEGVHLREREEVEEERRDADDDDEMT